jgi:hypothetical protein
LKNPTGKGKRLVIGHVGSEYGFLRDGQLVFEAKKGDGDYHDEMDGPKFELWWKRVLDNMKDDSAIVIDNAPYHTVQVEKFPLKSWRKNQLQEWLNRKNIAYEPKMTKAELMEVIAPFKPQF